MNNAKQKNINFFPWVFYVDIRKRKWFSYYWSTRGANFKEFQIFIFKITIGMPWKKSVLNSKINDYGNLKSAKNTNDANLKRRFSFQLGNYSKGIEI
jgi:hypothetical protein